MGYIQLSQGFTASSIAKKNRPCLVHSISHSPRQTVIHLQATVPSSDDAGSGGPIMDKASSLSPNPFFETVKLVGASFLVALLVISWEDVSMSHPMRTYMASSQPQQIGASTVRGLAFSQRDRQLLEEDMEPQALKEIPSFSEVSLKHRMERVPTWDETRPMTRQDVELAVQTIQKALVYLGECKTLATNYEWDDLTTHIRGPLLHSEMEQASALLKRANGFLSTQARDEIGFDWGSCAWRHCGALADAQESIDELDSLIGVLEPYECLFVLDIVERSFRDMLAVTTSYQDPSISIPEYQPIQRMVSPCSVWRADPFFNFCAHPLCYRVWLERLGRGRWNGWNRNRLLGRFIGTSIEMRRECEKRRLTYYLCTILEKAWRVLHCIQQPFKPFLYRNPRKIPCVVSFCSSNS
jgi:hypothetical protein